MAQGSPAIEAKIISEETNNQINSKKLSADSYEYHIKHRENFYLNLTWYLILV